MRAFSTVIFLFIVAVLGGTAPAFAEACTCQGKISPDNFAASLDPTDDGERINNAIDALPEGGTLCFKSRRYLVKSRIVFNKRADYQGCADERHPTVLEYAGPPTDRLADIHASGRFDHLSFHGGNRQVLGALLLVDDNPNVGSATAYSFKPAADLNTIDDLQFIDCKFGNIHGRHSEGFYPDQHKYYGRPLGGNSSANQFALMISPYGVRRFVIDGSRFNEIFNDNNGAHPLNNVGHAGGIIFQRPDLGDRKELSDNYLPPETKEWLQTNHTSGTVRNSTFDHIGTILRREDLPRQRSVNLSDADAIRFYSEPSELCIEVLLEDLFVSARPVPPSGGEASEDLSVLKRAVKTSPKTGCVSVRNIFVDSRGAPAPMTNVIRLSRGMDVDGVRYVGDARSAVHFVFDSFDIPESSSLNVRNVTADWVFGLWSFAPMYPDVLANITAKNFYVSNILHSGLRFSKNTTEGAVLPESAKNILFENFWLFAAPGASTAIGVSGPLATQSGIVSTTFKNFTLLNLAFVAPGRLITIDGLLIVMNDPDYSGPGGCGLDRRDCPGILQVGYSPFKWVAARNVVKNVMIHAERLSLSFLNERRRGGLLYLSGDQSQYSNIDLRTPEDIDVRIPHIILYGNHIAAENFNYSGPGAALVSSAPFPKSRQGSTRRYFHDVVLDHWTRWANGDAVAASRPFLVLKDGMDHDLRNISDYRIGQGVPTISIEHGQAPGTFRIANLKSRSESPLYSNPFGASLPWAAVEGAIDPLDSPPGAASDYLPLGSPVSALCRDAGNGYSFRIGVPDGAWSTWPLTCGG